MKNVITFSLIPMLAIFSLAGCSTPTVVKVEKESDFNLSCIELNNELAEAEKYKLAAREEDKFQLKHVGAGMLIVPALISLQNINQAEKNAALRIERLINIKNSKNCQ